LNEEKKNLELIGFTELLVEGEEEILVLLVVLIVVVILVVVCFLLGKEGKLSGGIGGVASALIVCSNA